MDEFVSKNDELQHWGILGMKWGVRRYQNEDGTLTPEGHIRYGVSTVAETKKLSYSQKYESLKNKSERTEKEEEQLKRLEKGKNFLEKCQLDTDKMQESLKDKSFEEVEELAKCAQDYLDSTNYGKGERFAETMAAIPTGAVGLAADAGLSYAMIKSGSPIVLYQCFGTLLGAGIGATAAQNAYEKKHKEQMVKELQEAFNKNKSNKKQQSKEKIKKADIHDLEKYRTDTDQKRKKAQKDRFWYGESVKEVSERTSREIKQDKAYSMVFANPQYYINKDGQWSFDGHTFGSVDALIDSLARSDKVV